MKITPENVVKYADAYPVLCTFCDQETATAAWSGGIDVFCCDDCAKTVLPAFIADAVFREYPDPEARLLAAKMVLETIQASFWRAIAHLEARSRPRTDLLGTVELPPVFQESVSPWEVTGDLSAVSSGGPANSGRRWSVGDVAYLEEAFERGETLERIANKLERTVGGVVSKLASMNKLQSDNSSPRWTVSDSVYLREVWEGTLSIERISENMSRTVAAILKKAKNLGLQMTDRKRVEI